MTDSLEQARGLAGAAGEYWCACFVCGSISTGCGHREPDLVLWWLDKQATVRTEPTRKRIRALRVVRQDTQNRPEALKREIPEPKRYPEPERARSFPRDTAYSGLRGW